MKFEYRKLNVGLILLYAACMIFTAYTLFQLQGALVYQSQVLSVPEMITAGPVFMELYLVVGITLFVGLMALLIGQNKKSTAVIYVEKKATAVEEDLSDNEEAEENLTLDISAIDAIAVKKDDEAAAAKDILVNVCKNLNAGTGIFYKSSKEKNKRILEIFASYALTLGESQTIKYEFGEGLVGQAALEEKTLFIDDVPEGYVKIVSGLGNAVPTHLLLLPVKKGKELYGVVEIASFTRINNNEAKFVAEAFKKLTEQQTTKTKKASGKDAGKGQQA